MHPRRPTAQRKPGPPAPIGHGGKDRTRPRPGRTHPEAAAGKGGLLDPRRAAPVPVVPAPPDRGGDELRDPPDGRAAGALDIRGPVPTTQEDVMNRIHHQRLIDQVPGLFVLLIVGAVLAGCASSAGAHTAGASPAHSRALAASTPAAASIVTSRHYGYTEALPAGWRLARQATQQWDGKGAPGYDNPVMDLFQGPGSLQAWADATPTNKNLDSYTGATIRAGRAAHPCPAPQTDQAITIGGAPARLLTMQCPAGSGFLVEIAVTVHHGTAFVFTSQHQPGTPVHKPADRAAFRRFLAGIGLQQ